MFQKTFEETPVERAHLYRLMAMTAEGTAAQAQLPAMRAAYLRSADRWHKLASLLEVGTGYTPKKIATRTRSHTRKAEKAQLDQTDRATGQAALT